MSSIAKRLKALPPMDDTIIKIEHIISNPNYDIDELVSCIAVDPMLVANILRFANSPAYHFRSEISSLKQAISIFGIHAIKGFIFYIFAQKTFAADLSIYNITNEYFLKYCAAQLSFALSWTLGEDPKIIKTLLPATFLCDIGRTVIAHEIELLGKKEEFHQKVKEVWTIEELRDLERFYLGTTSPELTVDILSIWKMDPAIVATIKDADPELDESCQKPASYLAVIKTMINIFGMYKEEALERARALVCYYGLNKEKFESTLRHKIADLKAV